MSNSNTDGGLFSCRTVCWILGIVFGLFVAGALVSKADWSVLSAAVVGIIIALISGWLLANYFCKNAPQAVSGDGDIAAPARVDSATEQSSEPELSAEPETVEAQDTPERPTIAPSKALAGEEELAQAKGDWKYEAPAQDEPAAETSPSETTGEPVRLSAAPAGGGDDLKQIKGVGPKLEQTLNGLGIYQFAQIADWSQKDIDWVDDQLNFKGRVIRDGWVEQAKSLTKGD